MMKYLYFLVVILIMGFTACKKDNLSQVEPEPMTFADSIAGVYTGVKAGHELHTDNGDTTFFAPYVDSLYTIEVEAIGDSEINVKIDGVKYHLQNYSVSNGVYTFRLSGAWQAGGYDRTFIFDLANEMMRCTYDAASYTSTYNPTNGAHHDLWEKEYYVFDGVKEP